METIFQSIEILSKEKGIDPQIVLDAVKDAMLIAARKHYRTNEDYVADMDPKTGAIQLYAVKKAAEAGDRPGARNDPGRSAAASTPRPRSAPKSAFRKTPTPWGASPRRPPNR